MNLDYVVNPYVVHIAFNGDEVERITEPIIQSKADKAYIFTYIEEKIDEDGNPFIKVDQMLHRYKKIVNILERHNIEVVKDIPEHIKHLKNKNGDLIDGIPISYHDYVAIIQYISKIIFYEREQNPNVIITINLAVGSKITAIASIDASRIWDVNVIYVQPQFWNIRTTPSEPLSSGRMDILNPPRFDLVRPENRHLLALKLIDNDIKNAKNTFLENLETIEEILGINLNINPDIFNDRELITNIFSSVRTNLTNLAPTIVQKINRLLQDNMALYHKITRGIKKSEFLKILRKNNLLHSPKYQGISIEEALTQRQISTLYGSLNKQFVNPLKKWGLITESNKHKNKEIQITKKGHLFLQMFKYDIEKEAKSYFPNQFI